jgi:NADH-quinone oxidoreductase subunit L
MLGPLVILAALSVGGGWIGAGRFGNFLAPAVGAKTAEAGSTQLEWILSGAAVVIALLGWFIADRLYRAKPERPAALAASLSGPYTVLVHKYWVDEIYGALIVKPALAISRFVLEWIVEFAILGGTAWLLAGTATFCGAILQRWQSGNLRSYAAWLTAGAAALLLFVMVPWLLGSYGIDIKWAGW